MTNQESERIHRLVSSSFGVVRVILESLEIEMTDSLVGGRVYLMGI